MHPSRDICSAAASARDWQELAGAAAPPMQQHFDASLVAFFELTPHRFYGAPGVDLPAQLYLERYYDQDPLQEVQRRLRPSAAILTDLVDAEVFESSPALLEFYRPLSIERVMVARLSGFGEAAPSSGVMVFRSQKQAAWQDSDLRKLSLLAPVLSGAAQRFSLDENDSRISTSVLDWVANKACLLVGTSGQAQWISQRAKMLLPVLANGELPEPLREQVRRFVANAVETQSCEIALDGTRLRVHLRLCETPSASVLVELTPDDNPDDILAAFAKQYALTRAELRVLQLLSRGQRPMAIKKTLYVSYDTVRSHLRHIYKKLGVHGSVEAVAKTIVETGAAGQR